MLKCKSLAKATSFDKELVNILTYLHLSLFKIINHNNCFHELSILKPWEEKKKKGNFLKQKNKFSTYSSLLSMILGCIIKFYNWRFLEKKKECRDHLFRTFHFPSFIIGRVLPASSFCFYWLNFKVIFYQMSCIYIISIITYKCIISVNTCNYTIIVCYNLLKKLFLTLQAKTYASC